MQDYKLNLRARQQPEPTRSPRVAKIILEDGVEIDYDARTQGSPTTVIAEGRHSTDIPTPREDEMDLDAPPTHRCVIMTDRKVGLHSGEMVKGGMGEIRWMSKDEAEFREKSRTVKVVEVRALEEAKKAERQARIDEPEASPLTAATPRKQAKASPEEVRAKRNEALRKARAAKVARRTQADAQPVA